MSRSHAPEHASHERSRSYAAVWLLAVLLLGCGGEPGGAMRPARTSVRADRQPARRSAPGARTRNVCERSPKSMATGPMPAFVSYYCGAGACIGPRVPLRLHNCTGGAVRVRQMEVWVLPWPRRSSPRRSTVLYTLEPKPLPPGGQILRKVGTRPVAGTYRMAVLVTFSDGKKVRLQTAAFRVRNGTAHDCRKWGCHWQGRFCNCPTRDKGKVCTRGSECEGICLHTGFRVVRKGRCKGPGPKPLGYAIGRCSSHGRRRVAGCYLFLRPNASSNLRVLCRVPVARSCGGCVISNSYFIDPTAPAKPRPRPRSKPRPRPRSKPRP